MCFTPSKRLPVLQYSCWLHTHACAHLHAYSHAPIAVLNAYCKHLIGLWAVSCNNRHPHLQTYEELQYYINQKNVAELLIISLPCLLFELQSLLYICIYIYRDILRCGWHITLWDYSVRWANYESNIITSLKIPFALPLNGKTQLGISMLH